MSEFHERHDLERVVHLLKELIVSTANLEKSIQTLSGNVAALIAANQNTVPQAAVDAAQAEVDAINATVVAQLPAPAPEPTPAQ